MNVRLHKYEYKYRLVNVSQILVSLKRESEMRKMYFNKSRFEIGI